MKEKKFPVVDPEFEFENVPQYIEWYLANVPKLPENELKKVFIYKFIGYKFLQDNGFTTRKLVNDQNDIKSLEVRVKDLSEDGLYFYRTSYQKYLGAIERGTDPEKACKNILERDFKKYYVSDS